METVAPAQSAELQATQESLQTVTSKWIIQDVVIDDLAKKLDGVEDAFYVIPDEMEDGGSCRCQWGVEWFTSSGDPMPVHPREPRVSTRTDDPETAFTYADLRAAGRIHPSCGL